MNKFWSIFLKIVISLIVLGIAIPLVIIINKKLKNDSKAESYGHMTVIVIDIDGNEVENKVLEYDEGATTWDTLYNAFKDTIDYKEDHTYGVKLLAICGIETDFVNTYLALYVNDVYSNRGLTTMELVDGMVLKIVETSLH